MEQNTNYLKEKVSFAEILQGIANLAIIYIAYVLFSLSSKIDSVVEILSKSGIINQNY